MSSLENLSDADMTVKKLAQVGVGREDTATKLGVGREDRAAQLGVGREDRAGGSQLLQERQTKFGKPDKTQRKLS